MNRFARLAGAVLIGAVGYAGVAHWVDTPVRGETTYSMASASARYIVRSIVVGNVFFTVRIDTTNGDAWFTSNGKWVKYNDAVPLGPGSYDVQILPMPDGKTYNLCRWDVNTGRTWYIMGTNWSAVGEQ